MAPTGTSTDDSTSEMKISLKDVHSIIPDFDGNPKDLDKFIACGNLLFSSTKAAKEQTLFLEFVKTRLQGPAFELIQYKTCDNWDTLAQELKTHFKEEKSRTAIQSEISQTKQLYKESAKEYGERLSKLLMELNSATYSDIDDTKVREYLIKENHKLVIKAFEDGLKNHSLKLLVKAHGGTDLTHCRPLMFC